MAAKDAGMKRRPGETATAAQQRNIMEKAKKISGGRGGARASILETPDEIRRRISSGDR